MDASTQFHDAVSGQYTIAGPQASHGGSNNFHFYGPRAPADPAERNPSEPRKPFSTVPFPPDPDFVDRPDILKWMHEKCARPAARIALVGLGGIGKSQLAVQYAHQVRQRSPNTWVFWVHASTRGRFEESYQSIADRLELPRRNDPDINVLRLVSEWLRVEENGPWKMIVDNADDADVFSIAQGRLASFLTQSCHGSIIVTSRSMDVAERLVGGRSNLFVIPVMEGDEACQLLRGKLGLNHDDESVADLVRVLDYMPLAITQAAAFINRRAPRMSISKYLDEFRRSDKKRANLLNREAGDLRRDESASNSIVNTWQITFNQIRRERPSAANLLSFMSFFNPQGIPEFVLHDYNTDLTDSMDSDTESDEFEDDLDVLRGYSLVSTTAAQDVCEVHSLVQFCTRAWISMVDDAERWRQLFLRSISRHFPSGAFETWPTCQLLLPHIESVLEERPPDEDLRNWAYLLTNCAYYMLTIGNYTAAEKLGRKAVETRAKLLGKEHPDTLTSMANLASTFRNQGRWKEAEELEVGVMETTKRVLGEEHPGTLTSMANLASTFWNQGRWKEAEELQVGVIETTKRVLGEEHPDTLTSMNNLAITWKDQDRTRDALALMRSCVVLREQVLGIGHPDTASSVAVLAKWENMSDLSGEE